MGIKLFSIQKGEFTLSNLSQFYCKSPIKIIVRYKIIQAVDQ
jgi:hypothetical protein